MHCWDVRSGPASFTEGDGCHHFGFRSPSLSSLNHIFGHLRIHFMKSCGDFIGRHVHSYSRFGCSFDCSFYSTALLQRRLSGCRLDECVALQHNCTDVLPAVKRAVHIIVAAIISDVHTSAAREAQRCSLTAYCGRYRGLAHCESRDDNEWNPYNRHPTDAQDDVAGLSGQRNCDCDRRCRPRDDRARRAGDGDGRRSLARSEVVARKNHWSPYRTEDR